MESVRTLDVRSKKSKYESEHGNFARCQLIFAIRTLGKKTKF